MQTSPENNPPHWLGILLLTTNENVRFPDDDSLNNYSVIDGQQRLVTLFIWISALCHHAEDNGESINFDLKKLAQLHPQKIDEKPLQVVMENQWLNPKYLSLQESRVLRAYRYFRYVLWLGQDAILEGQPLPTPKHIHAENLSQLHEFWEKFLKSSKAKGQMRTKKVESREMLEATRQRLMVVTLIHEPLIDEPQAVIFDTLNGNRQALEPLDHIRNSIFVRLGKEEAAELFDRYWEPAENVLRDSKLARQNPGVNFIYDYVISKGEKKRQGTINKGKGAVHFARLTKNLRDAELVEFLCNDLVLAMLAWPVVVRQKDNIDSDGLRIDFSKPVLDCLSTIQEVSSNPANPLVLHYVTHFAKGNIVETELLARLMLIENYIVRMILSNEPLSPLRSRIMEVCAHLENRVDEVSLVEALRKGGWVHDKSILKDFEKRDFYDEASPAALGAIFRGIEVHLSGSGANRFRVGRGSDLYTIEHIFPRKHGPWSADLIKWKADPKKTSNLMNTLGNLTVVTQEHNSRVGNNRLYEKQAYPTVVGAAAPLRIHDGWLTADKWTEHEIQARSLALVNYALSYWPDI